MLYLPTLRIKSVRDGKEKAAEFEQGELTTDHKEAKSTERNGTETSFIADDAIFKNYRYINDYIDTQFWNYAYLNPGLTINFNGEKYHSEDGLKDLLKNNTDDSVRYPIIHLRGEDIEFAFTHWNQYGEQYYSFVNGQNTTQGGTHLNAFKEAVS